MAKSQLQRLAMEKAQAFAPRTAPDPERRAAVSRNLAEAKIAAYIERTLAAAPPLNPQQIRTLTGLLRAGGQR
ncbi:hypothetical protein [Microbacterium cremeum]|uniref:hypothetical protein n=1 Tax=Microbacterium cremeum TaxID=2782169 RepID=UPI001E483DFA|nr:hypothetical protein [Microbacterium cremeum]